jgi:putative iron-dependent peroxidase
MRRGFATAQPAVMNRNMGHNQWYVHMSRVEGSDLGHIKQAIKDLRAACKANNVNCAVGLGPSFVKDLTNDGPADFSAYPGYKSVDGSGREAKATQEELLVWLNDDDKGKIWQAQYDVRNALEGHMKVARETPTFNYGPSKDLTGFTDGTGNPEVSEDVEVMLVPEGQPGAGGTFAIAQRWVHDLKSFNSWSVSEQEAVFGRTKEGSVRLDPQPEHSHVNHVELREKHGDVSSPKVKQMSRRSTPYAFHDGTVGLYFMGFCKSVAPLDERMRMMYGMDGQVRDGVTNYSQPASGSYYFFPATEVLDAM